MAQSFVAEVVVKAGKQGLQVILGEGPHWDARVAKLYWVDIKTNMLFQYDPLSGENRPFPLPSSPGCAVTSHSCSNHIIVALHDGVYSYDLDSGSLQQLARSAVQAPDLRFNDGKCDPKGRMWCGTMTDDRVGAGALYRLEGDFRTITRVLDNISISNGLAWTSDLKTMYYIDSPLKQVMAFDYDNATGNLSNRRIAIEFSQPGDGVPDGMTIDQEQNLWVAHWTGSKVTCFDPRTGARLREIALPVSHVTSCCFGGPLLRDLYITSSSCDTDLEVEPLAGSLFVVKNCGQGLPSHQAIYHHKH